MTAGRANDGNHRTASPLRGRYLVRNPASNAFLRVTDLALELLTPRSSVRDITPPKRLLLAVGGHLGDAVIATSALGMIRSAWPEVTIGVVSGGWNAPIFENHPDVRWFHAAEHWRLDRSGDAWLTRAIRAVRSQRAALTEVRKVGYDTAIDLYPYYPNASRLLKKAGIPTRVGYASGGGGPRYTRAIEWEPGGHVVADHQRLVAVLSTRPHATPNYGLAPIAEEDAAAAAAKLRAAGVAGNYVVLHMGAGSERKTWPRERWVAVARGVLATGRGVVLTGAGDRDRDRVRELQRNVAGVADLCDRLNWNEFRHVLEGANLTVSVDTVAAHLSAASGTPTIVIMTGMDEPSRWRPLGDHVSTITERVPCFPCYRSNGCAAMSCISLVAADSVLSIAAKHMASSTQAAARQ